MTNERSIGKALSTIFRHALLILLSYLPSSAYAQNQLANISVLLPNYIEDTQKNRIEAFCKEFVESLRSVQANIDISSHINSEEVRKEACAAIAGLLGSKEDSASIEALYLREASQIPLYAIQFTPQRVIVYDYDEVAASVKEGKELNVAAPTASGYTQKPYTLQIRKFSNEVSTPDINFWVSKDIPNQEEYLKIYFADGLHTHIKKQMIRQQAVLAMGFIYRISREYLTQSAPNMPKWAIEGCSLYSGLSIAALWFGREDAIQAASDYFGTPSSWTVDVSSHQFFEGDTTDPLMKAEVRQAIELARFTPFAILCEGDSKHWNNLTNFATQIRGSKRHLSRNEVIKILNEFRKDINFSIRIPDE
jgi:hypothetical protein